MAKKRIDIEELQRWVRAGATIVEVAKRLGIGVRTLNNRLAEPEFRKKWDEAQGELYISLRAKQVALALTGNPTMLIWLGKQYLGQKERSEVSGTGAGGAITLEMLDGMRAAKRADDTKPSKTTEDSEA